MVQEGRLPLLVSERPEKYAKTLEKDVVYGDFSQLLGLTSNADAAPQGARLAVCTDSSKPAQRCKPTQQ